MRVRCKPHQNDRAPTVAERPGLKESESQEISVSNKSANDGPVLPVVSGQPVDGSARPNGAAPDGPQDPVLVAAAVVEVAEVRSLVEALVLEHHYQLANGADDTLTICGNALQFEQLGDPFRVAQFAAVAIAMLAERRPAAVTGDRHDG